MKNRVEKERKKLHKEAVYYTLKADEKKKKDIDKNWENYIYGGDGYCLTTAGCMLVCLDEYLDDCCRPNNPDAVAAEQLENIKEANEIFKKVIDSHPDFELYDEPNTGARNPFFRLG